MPLIHINNLVVSEVENVVSHHSQKSNDPLNNYKWIRNHIDSLLKNEDYSIDSLYNLINDECTFNLERSISERVEESLSPQKTVMLPEGASVGESSSIPQLGHFFNLTEHKDGGVTTFAISTLDDYTEDTFIIPEILNVDSYERIINEDIEVDNNLQVIPVSPATHAKLQLNPVLSGGHSLLYNYGAEYSTFNIANSTSGFASGNDIFELHAENFVSDEDVYNHDSAIFDTILNNNVFVVNVDIPSIVYNRPYTWWESLKNEAPPGLKLPGEKDFVKWLLE